MVFEKTRNENLCRSLLCQSLGESREKRVDEKGAQQNVVQEEFLKTY